MKLQNASTNLGKTIGTWPSSLSLPTLRNPKQIPISKVTELLNDHETVIVSLRKGIDISEKENKDIGTADFLTGMLQEHETIAWILQDI
jgi:starvation-inducible DNA-binding protein